MTAYGVLLTNLFHHEKGVILSLMLWHPNSITPSLLIIHLYLYPSSSVLNAINVIKFLNIHIILDVLPMRAVTMY